MSRCPALIVVVAVAAVEASAAQRTFVRSDGIDTNPCSIASPCRSFATAIAHTDPDGEIVVLDSAGYGIVTVNKGVTITAPPGIYAGVSVPNASDGITVAASGKKVVLRGLAINGQGGDNGINIAAAAEVHIEHCIVSNMFSDGIRITSGGAVYVDHVVLRSNLNNGINIASGGSDLFVDDSRIANNVYAGIFVESGRTTVNRVAIENNGANGVGIVPNGGADPRLSVRDSLIAANAGSGVLVLAGAGTTARAEVEHTSIVRNAGDGVYVDGAAATLTVTDVTMTRNGGYAMDQLNGSTLRSPGNNIVDGKVAGALNGSITSITPM